MLRDLNDRQREAVLNTEGAILILAGAGSGKTKVITTKIGYLIKEKKVFPENIMAITFTNKAAKEMKNRVFKSLGGDAKGLFIGTFHSVATRILRIDIDKLGYSSNFTIYDRLDQLTVIREGLKELNIAKEDFTESSLISVISRSKTNGIDVDMFYKMNDSSFRGRKFAMLYEYYEAQLRQNNALDFDDLLIKVVELFKKYPKVLDYYSRKTKYIFVDEYQDTNSIQYQFIKLISSAHGNITAVGDADQSIYAFRGADINNILNFERDFKSTKKILLEQNYRSTKSILDAANVLIDNNTERPKKNLWTDIGKGEPVIYKELFDNQGEAEFVFNTINELYNHGYTNDDIAILYRTNAQSRNFEECFMKYNLPYKIVGGLKFYDRKEVKDLVSYLKLIVNPSDNVALKRIINEPKRGIGPSTVAKLEESASIKNSSLFLSLYDEEILNNFSQRQKGQLLKFRMMIDEIVNRQDELSILELTEELLDKSGMIRELEKDATIESKSRIENLKEFKSVIFNYELEHTEDSLEDFVKNLSLMTDGDKTDEGDRKITLMTIHGAKGLEFPVVFVVGMEEGMFPSNRSIEEGEVEEERRLCYVALTRAKERLFLSSVNYRTLYGNRNIAIRSRFIGEMEGKIINATDDNKAPKEYKVISKNIETHIKNNFIAEKKRDFIEKKDVGEIYKVGDRIRHKHFGEGMVVQIKPKEDDTELTISFDGKGIKRISQSIARLEKL